MDEENTDTNLYLSSFQGASFFSGHCAVRSVDTLLAHKDTRDQASKIIPKNLENIENFKADNLNGFLNSDKQKISDLHKNHIDVGKTGTISFT